VLTRITVRAVGVVAQRSPTLTYLVGRDRVLGGLWVHRNTALAFEMLATKLGSRHEARIWLLEALDESDRR
jgi:hypothetical protein